MPPTTTSKPPMAESQAKKTALIWQKTFESFQEVAAVFVAADVARANATRIEEDNVRYQQALGKVKKQLAKAQKDEADFNTGADARKKDRDNQESEEKASFNKTRAEWANKIKQKENYYSHLITDKEKEYKDMIAKKDSEYKASSAKLNAVNKELEEARSILIGA